ARRRAGRGAAVPRRARTVPDRSHAHGRGPSRARLLHDGSLPRGKPLRDPLRAPRGFHGARGDHARAARCARGRGDRALRRPPRALLPPRPGQLLQLPPLLEMTAGPRAVAFAALLALATTARGAWDVAALMRLLKEHPAGRARFSETKHVSILDRPLESSGELLFTPPDRLERRVTSPGAERMVADRDRLVVE